MPTSRPLPDETTAAEARPPVEAAAPAEPPARPPCPAPANFRAEVSRYDAAAEIGQWDGPRYRMTYRILGQGPPFFLVPGIASTYRIYTLLLNRLAEHFRTISFDYPGEHPDDGARLAEITHDDLVDDVFGLIDHLKVGRAFVFGASFGSTVALRMLHREPRRFPRAAVQGGFAYRPFTPAEHWALRLGRLIPGTAARLPFRRRVLAYNSRLEFPSLLDDRWDYHLEQHALTPIRSLAHRSALLTRLDLRPILPAIPTELLLIQGNEDRVVPRRDFEVLRAALPKAEAAILPTVGHLPHLTHAEVLAQVIHQWLLPCAEGPGGCTAHGGPCPE
jgi:pimeloyl-ACP methyl ester carboxylesterase